MFSLLSKTFSFSLQLFPTSINLHWLAALPITNLQSGDPTVASSPLQRGPLMVALLFLNFTLLVFFSYHQCLVFVFSLCNLYYSFHSSFCYRLCLSTLILNSRLPFSGDQLVSLGFTLVFPPFLGGSQNFKFPTLVCFYSRSFLFSACSRLFFYLQNCFFPFSVIHRLLCIAFV